MEEKVSWFYANESDEQVPVDNEEALQKLAESGRVRPDTLVWNESMSDWLPCRQLKPEWFSGGSKNEDSTSASTTESAATTPAVVSPAASPHSLQPTDPSPALPLQPKPSATDGMALASMICGTVGLFFMGCYGAGFPIAVAAVICGHLCRRRLVEAGDTTSAGMALAGLITGYIALGLFLLVVLGFLAFFAIGMAGAAAQ